jgi:FKBP-type peptidyl-prolyl cis-trans isomerase
MVVMLLAVACRKAPPLPTTALRSSAVLPGAERTLPAPAGLKSPPADASTTSSGLVTKVLRKGTGDRHPEPQDLVEVHYIAWSADGTVFDSSLAANAPVQLSVDAAIPGWSEGLQLMTAGEKRRLWVPVALAYGDERGPLVFDVELLKVIQRPRPLPAPDDVSHPPPTARHGRSGMAYRILVRGTGTRHPQPDDTVDVEYTGWSSDGRMIDSSATHAQPITFRAGGLGEGWTEALRVMVTGEKARFWMPAALVGWAGPAPMVVYDIGLRAIR